MKYLDSEPYEDYAQNLNAAGTSADLLETDILASGWLYYIHNIVALNAGSGITQAAVGYMSGKVFRILQKQSAQNPFESVGFSGLAVLRGGQQIRAQFYNTSSGEKLYLFVNGVKRRL